MQVKPAMFKYMKHPIAAAILSAIITAANAAPVTYDWTGTFFDHGPASTPFNVLTGQSISGSFTFDFAVIRRKEAEEAAYYDATGTMHFSVAGTDYDYVGTTAQFRIFKTSYDGIGLDTNLDGPTFGGFYISGVTFALTDWTGTALSDIYSLPEGLSVADFSPGHVGGSMHAWKEGNIFPWTLGFQLTSFGRHEPSTLPVPEPQTYAMVLGGLGVLGVAMVRRRRLADA